MTYGPISWSTRGGDDRVGSTEYNLKSIVCSVISTTGLEPATCSMASIFGVRDRSGGDFIQFAGAEDRILVATFQGVRN